MSDAETQLEAGLRRIETESHAESGSAPDEESLRAVNARLLGPRGELTALMKLLPETAAERRRVLGQRLNALKRELTQKFEASLLALRRALREREIRGASIDVTLPGRGVLPGKLHPLTRITHELQDIFVSLGFQIADGPEIDHYEYNFDKLAFPPDHPATDMQDSFFVAHKERVLLRTHTSTIQVREMLRRQPPIAVVAAGACYRRDDDATHSPMFFQIEGLLVDEKVSFADLKGTLSLFVAHMFGAKVPFRIRPSYFPFVEPGGEMDIGCIFCRPWESKKDSGCRICKRTGWLEISGCGMVHPAVFENVGYDSSRFTGFAFGMGIDRIAMLKYAIPDIRLLYENDFRFLASL